MLFFFFSFPFFNADFVKRFLKLQANENAYIFYTIYIFSCILLAMLSHLC